MREVMCMALRQLQRQLPLGEVSASGSAFFRHGQAPTPFSVPPSEEYLRELHACWRDPRTLSCLSTDSRVLAAMHESQLWRRWSELFRRARLASSFLASAGVWPLLPLNARAVLPLARVLGRYLSMVIDLGVSIPERCGRDLAGTFVSHC
ncbi:hypothetical protein GOODEAATRI_001120 [Goodea atripinnis]|uniref:Uncharacterized protein n=1 Tax=Goodea atripinnis TaxID=208336 RepID=A0ABV0ME18_9TELE